jgi:signal transduction histidine kinase
VKADGTRILIVGGVPADAEAIHRALRAATPNAHVRVVGSLNAYRDAVAQSTPDLVVLDCDVPAGCAASVLASLVDSRPYPIIVMTSRGDDATAVALMKAGALDYIVKSPDAFASMPRQVERALREWGLATRLTRAEDALRESERRSLEPRLRQAQRLEAIGHLAGAVAHDYNNILAATMITLGLLQGQPELGSQARQLVTDLQQLADRAAKLTRQLLMFSRQSVLRVQPLDLNEILRDLHKMLRRLLGEHVDLEFVGQAGLPRVDADAGMMEQVVISLCVNSRDAMPRGGRLQLLTSVVNLDEAYVQTHRASRPGRFVCLSVAESGHGTSPDVVERAFEPSPARDAGKGTALGLATVHAIVKLHSGWVEVDDRRSVGSTVRVYLPVSGHPVSPGSQDVAAGAPLTPEPAAIEDLP